KETIKGKGYLKLFDYARFTEQMGATHMISLNTFSDDVAQATALLEDLAYRGVPLRRFFLGDEPQYWSKGPVSLFNGGADYAEKMYPFALATLDSYPDAQLVLAYSDALNENNFIFDAELATYAVQNGYSSDKYWHQLNIHAFPGVGDQELAEGMLAVNAELHERTPHIIDYYLPLNGIPEVGDPVPDDLRFAFASFNVRLTTEYIESLFTVLFNVEYALRMSTHPRVDMTAMFALTSHCVETTNDHRNTMKKVGKSNWGALDSQVLDYGHYVATSCQALREVNRAVNGSSVRWPTTVLGGALVDYAATAETPIEQAPGLYAQTYRGDDGLAHLMVTDRSAQTHTVSVVVDGALVDGPLDVWQLGDDDPGLEVVAPAAVLTMVQTSQPNPITVPAYSVTRVAWPLDTADQPPPDDLLAQPTPGTPHAIDVTWSAVEGATLYRLKYGVVSGHYPHILMVPADDTGSLSVHLEPMGHDIDQHFTVSAVVDGEETANALEVVTAATNHAPLASVDFDDAGALSAWTAPADWSLSGAPDGALSVTYTGPPTHAWLTEPTFTDYDVSVTVETGALDPNSWFGLLVRYQDEDNHYEAIYETSKNRYNIYRKVDGVRELVTRSAPLGQTYFHTDQTTPWFPPIALFTTDTPHTFRATADGQTLRFWVDGRLIAAGHDPSFSGGKVGLMSRHQSVTFDDLVVQDRTLYGTP
ncbi:MAG: family 16 glycoside hydrolase, partial [Polyangiaceae bacterium]